MPWQDFPRIGSVQKGPCRVLGPSRSLEERNHNYCPWHSPPRAGTGANEDPWHQMRSMRLRGAEALLPSPSSIPPPVFPSSLICVSPIYLLTKERRRQQKKACGPATLRLMRKSEQMDQTSGEPSWPHHLLLPQLLSLGRCRATDSSDCAHPALQNPGLRTTWFLASPPGSQGCHCASSFLGDVTMLTHMSVMGFRFGEVTLAELQ